MNASDESIDNLSIDEKAGCVDIDLPFEPREKGLFNVCLLVGLNYMTGEAYVKSVFPSQVGFFIIDIFFRIIGMCVWTSRVEISSLHCTAFN